jgi:AraC-like DNA-binding protein
MGMSVLFLVFYTLAGCLLLAIVLGIRIYYRRQIKKKNRKLYCRGKERNRSTPKAKQMSRRKSPRSAENESESARQQRQLVAALHEYLLTNRNFTRNDFTRDKLSAILTTNRTSLQEAIKSVTGKTLQEYFNSLRLEEAKRMLENRSGYTVEAIALECGFNAVNTFYRLFRQQYGVTPAEYRKMAEQKSSRT